MLTFSRAGLLKQSHEIKLQMNQLNSTFALTINVKMILTRTNDFFHDLRALASLQSVQNQRRGSVIFKINAD